MIETRLVISRGGFPPFSARGCTQSLTPIETGALRRTVNGELLYLSGPCHQKYCSIIRCEDQESPALDNLWPGEQVEISCIQYLWQKLQNTKSILDRPARPDSIKVVDDAQTSYAFHLDQQQITLETKSLGPWYVAYQPLLKMRVVTFSLEHQEWGEKNPWVITLEEI